MDEYEKFEAECKKIRNENDTLLKDFERYLKKKKQAWVDTLNRYDDPDCGMEEV